MSDNYFKEYDDSTERFKYEKNYLDNIKKRYKDVKINENKDIESRVFEKISRAHSRKLQFTSLSQYETSSGHTPLLRVLTSNTTSEIGIDSDELSYMIKKSAHDHLSKYGNTPLMVALKKNVSENLKLTVDDFKFMVFNSNLEIRDNEGLNAAKIAVKCFKSENLPLTKELLDYVILSTESLGFNDDDLKEYKYVMDALSKSQQFKDEVFSSKNHDEAVMLGYHDKLNEVLKNQDILLTQNKKLNDENLQLRKDYGVFRKEVANFFNNEDNKSNQFLKPGLPTLSVKMQGIIHDLKKEHNIGKMLVDDDEDWVDEEKMMDDEFKAMSSDHFFSEDMDYGRTQAKKIHKEIESKMNVAKQLKRGFKF